MTFFCDNCQYIEECKPHKDNPQSIGCCDFGLFDEDGLIEDWDKEQVFLLWTFSPHLL